MMKKICWLTFVLLMGSWCQTIYAAPKVVASIKPLHGLVAYVMQGRGEPESLLPDHASPHTFQLKPSQASSIQNADIIFWVGPELETFMQKSLSNRKGKTVALITIPDLTLLPVRDSGQWQHDHEHNHGHHHGSDPHIWLSPENALVMVDAIASALSELDPEYQTVYKENAKQFKQDTLALKQSLYESLHTIQDKPFMVFHDAYQYFEVSFELQAKGCIVANPHAPLSGHALHKLRKKIASDGIYCVFTEPEFTHYPIHNVLKGLDVQVKELDPLGTHIDKGPQHYFMLLKRLCEVMLECAEQA